MRHPHLRTITIFSSPVWAILAIAQVSKGGEPSIAPLSVGVSTASSTVLVSKNNPQCSNNQLTDTEIQTILDIHNKARAEVGVAPLVWNCKLADYAQRWVNKDVWNHSSNQELSQIIPGSRSGENLAVAAPATQPIATIGPLDWLAEKKFWNNKAGQCKAGKVCTHYTQVVWQKTTQIGCGLNRKSNAMGSQWSQNALYLSCIYNPAGNFADAAGRMKPYK
jgi:Cysteine-rich secretory protein family